MTEWLKRITKSDIRSILSIISVVGAFVMIYLLIIKPIPVENKDTVNLAMGLVFGGLIGGVSGYYYGASKEKADDKKEKEEE